MLTPEIENIIVKYLTSQVSMSELDELEVWISKNSNEDIFKNYVKINYLIDYNMEKFNTDHSKQKLMEFIKNEKKVIKMKSFHRIMKYVAAAVVISALALTYIFKDTVFNNQNSIVIAPKIINNNIKPGTDKATLTLQNGKKIALGKGINYKTHRIKSNGKKIIYEAIERGKKEIAYNYLTIPRGGQFLIKLSDGTKVWLNSETQLKYPTSFTDGKTRKVELIYGEAYFEVSPSTKHASSKFIVSNNSQEVEVLGTKFNIKAYRDENWVYTTLVEGKVAINTAQSKNILTPNQQAVVDTKTLQIEISAKNAKNEIAWINGEFILNHSTLKEIMKVLSRWYDMDVIFENKYLKQEKFVGIIRKSQDITDILDNIKGLGILNNYEIYNKTLILK